MAVINIQNNFCEISFYWISAYIIYPKWISYDIHCIEQLRYSKHITTIFFQIFWGQQFPSFFSVVWNWKKENTKLSFSLYLSHSLTIYSSCSIFQMHQICWKLYFCSHLQFFPSRMGKNKKKLWRNAEIHKVFLLYYY